MPWYGFDFYADEAVKLMSWEQKGVYLFLLWHAWHEGSIPSDHAELAELLGMRRSVFNRLWPRIAVKWHASSPGRLTNNRLEHERKRLEDRAKKLSEAGQNGNARRWGGDRQTSSPGDPNAIASLSLPCSSRAGSERAGTVPDEGQGGQGQKLLGEVLGRILVNETHILNRDPGREVKLLGAGKQAASKGLTEEKLRRLISLSQGKDRPSGWIRWVLQGDRWDEELKLTEASS